MAREFPTLLGLVAARLKAHAPTGPTGDLVLAAFQGRPAIEAVLAGERVAAPSTADVEARTRPAEEGKVTSGITRVTARDSIGTSGAAV